MNLILGVKDIFGSSICDEWGVWENIVDRLFGKLFVIGKRNCLIKVLVVKRKDMEKYKDYYKLWCGNI